MKHTLKFLTFLAAILLTNTAWSIVNIESHVVGDLPDGYSGHIDFNVAGQSGNTEKLNAGVGGRLNWASGKHTFFMLADYQYGESEGQKDTNKSFAHARYIQSVTASYAWESFIQVETDEFRRLEPRLMLGGGARFSWLGDDKNHAHILGVGMFYQVDFIANEPGEEDEGTEETLRGNFYWTYKAKINERVSFVNTIYVQPSLKDLGDILALDQLALVVNLMDKLDLKLGLDIAYDSKPADDLVETDTVYSAALRYSY